MKKKLLLMCVCLGFLSTGFSQTVSIINKKFVVNGNASCPIYFNGVNTPWDNWNDFGGNYDAVFWSTHFATLKANGINASRVWISCNGDVQPNINTDGTVTGASTQFWANLDNFFQSAQANGIYIMATMMSFDHTKNTYVKYQSWRNMLNDQTKVQTYCDNYLVPFVNRYKSNPYLMSIDISNEIEWVAEDATNMRCSYAVLQRFVAMCASAIHNNPRTDGSFVLVTLGSAATKWNATKMRIGSNGAWSQNNSDGNKWSDAALKAQYNQANAILDYYSPHYYSWIDQYYSNPFERTPADFGIDDKAVVIGETPAGNPGTPNLTPLASYNALKNNGYQGHFPWTSNGVDAIGDISKFGADAKTFATNNNALVFPTCTVTCATVAPSVTTPVVYCRNATSSALTATGIALKWYVDNTTTSSLTGAPIPLTGTTGTINYYVSQTLNGCEGPRALVAVTVNALPTAAITTTTPTTFCQGGSVTLTSSTGTLYQWINAAGPITGATNATYFAIASGSYAVKVTNANNCSATSTATAVTVNALPIATITTTTPTTFCQDGNVLLAASTGASYQWINAAGPITGATNATYSAIASGSYTVKVTNANNCSATSGPTAVTVNAIPTATISTTTPTTFCQGGSVTLTSSTGASYQWNNAAGPITVATNATYSAIASGSYTVKVTNANNCSATSSPTTVTVNALPTAVITTTTPTTFCQGGSVTLTSSTGTLYQWNNAAGPITGATNATYSAITTGSYTVKVTNANNCSATSGPTAVTVNALPIAAITTTTPTAFCQGGSVTLTSSTGASYQWNNTAGPITGATNATYSAIASGSYTVKVTNANNCSATSGPTAVTVNAIPTATISTTTPTTFCQGGSVTLTSSTGASYQWNNAAGPITGATNATYSAIASGSYTVKVTNANNCSATSGPTAVTVNAIPTAVISTTTPTTFCQGGSVTLTSSTGILYQWNNAAGPIPGATNATYFAITTGSYIVKVTNANNCSATSGPTAVTVNALPIAAITTTTPTTFCQGGSVTLTSSTGTLYQWNNASGPITGATNVTYSAVASGSYTVKVTNANNCSATSDPTAVTVNALPTATISTTTPTTFCQGGSVTLTSSPGASYQWNNAAGPITGATNVTYSAVASGSYTVKVTNANNCSATSDPTAVTVNALPTATISTTTPTTFCQGGSVTLTSSTGASYQWNNTAGPISNATSSTYSATTSGSYTVKVTNANNCSATSSPTAVTVNALPTAVITTTTPTTFCQGGSVTLTSSTGASYQWNNTAGPISNATSSTYSATTSGSYTVKVTNANNCSATSIVTAVNVTTTVTWYQDLDGDGKGDAAVSQTSCTQPTGYISVAGDGCPADANKFAPGACGCGNLETDSDNDLTANCIDTDDDNDGILDAADCAPLNAAIGSATVWYQDLDGDSKGDPTVTQTSCTQPTGYVSVSGDGCPTDANKISAGICGCGIAEGTCQTTGVVDLKSTEAIKIMPNPSLDQFNLILAESAIVYISTVEGKLVETFQNVNDIKFGSEYAKGIYVIQIMNGSTSQVIRIIKQ